MIIYEYLARIVVQLGIHKLIIRILKMAKTFEVVEYDPQEEVLMPSRVLPKGKGEFIPFIMVGQRGYSGYAKQGVYAVDAIAMLLGFNKSEQWFMQRLMEELEDNVSVIRGKDLTKSEQNKLNTAYKSLHTKDIVTRICREYFMINPMFFVPKPSSKDKIIAKWINLNNIKP